MNHDSARRGDDRAAPAGRSTIAAPARLAASRTMHPLLWTGASAAGDARGTVESGKMASDGLLARTLGEDRDAALGQEGNETRTGGKSLTGLNFCPPGGDQSGKGGLSHMGYIREAESAGGELLRICSDDLPAGNRT